MSLRLRARYFYAFFGLCGFGLLALLFYAIHVERLTDRDLKTMVETRIIVSEVRTAGFEYVMSREERPRNQMKKGIRIINGQLDRIRASPSFQANAAELKGPWEEAVSALQESEQFLDQLSLQPLDPAQHERDRRTANLFLSRSLALVASVNAMEHHLFEGIGRQHELLRRGLATAFFGLLAIMVLALALVQRAVLRPLAEMVSAVRTVSEGNLDLRMGRSEQDEFGQLARAFDQMLDEIKTMMVSRDSLEAEVQQRTRAEAEARAAYQQLRETQERMLQMEKLSALGTLVGGLAHEINNPLMGIRGYLGYAIDHSEEGRPKEMLQRAGSEVDRIGRIVKNMLVFARSKSPLSTERVDVLQVVHNVATLVEADLRQLDINLELVLPEAPLLVEGSPDNLQQAVLNLLLNARDALREQPLPRTVNVAVGASGTHHCTLAVSDNGPGVPEAIRTRIFDPFFTTKSAGQGTGLGLAVTQQLVEACGGTIGLRSALRKGASFVIELKRAEVLSA